MLIHEVEQYILAVSFTTLSTLCTLWYIFLDSSKLVKQYFFPAYIIKCIYSIAFFVIYQFHYTKGDTFLYYKRGIQNSIYNQPSLLEYISYLFSYSKHSTDFNVKIISLLNTICFNNYLCLNIIYGIIVLIGSWKFFVICNTLFDEYIKTKHLFICVFAIPSVCFWSCGLLKDGLCFASIGYIFYGIYNKNLSIIYKICSTLICFYMLFKLKAYLVIALLPILFLCIGWSFRNRCKGSFLKIAYTIMLIYTMPVCFYIGKTWILDTTIYSIDNIAKIIQGFHSYHKSLGGSFYSLHISEFAMESIIKKLPNGLLISLSQPNIFSSKNLLMYIASIENILLVILCLHSLILLCHKRVILRVLQTYSILVFLIFSTILLSFTGVTSYNFGALSRYRIIALPMLSISYFYMLGVYRNTKQKNIY